MKQRKSDKPENCSEMQELQLRKHLEEVTPEQEAQLAQHLSNCGGCRQFQQALRQMHQTMRVDDNSALQLRPGIRDRIHERMRAVPAGTENRGRVMLSGVLEGLRQLLQYRVPAYQALLVLMGLMLIFALLNPFVSVTEKPAKPDLVSIPPDSVVFERYHGFIRSQLKAGEKAGRNLQEDSTLIRFTVSSL